MMTTLTPLSPHLTHTLTPLSTSTLIPRHNLGNYMDRKPKLSADERIQKHATDRFMTGQSRVLLRKFASDKPKGKIRRVHRSGTPKKNKSLTISSSTSPSNLLNSARTSMRSPTSKQEYYTRTAGKNKWSYQMEMLKSQPTILDGLRKGMTGMNNPGGIHKLFEEEDNNTHNTTTQLLEGPSANGPSMNGPSTDTDTIATASRANPKLESKHTTKRWLQMYEERVGKMYEKHRCRINGGGGQPDSPGDVQDMALYDFTHQNMIEDESKKDIMSRMATKTIDLTENADGTSRYGDHYEPRFTQPQPLAAGSARNKFCEGCNENCAPVAPAAKKALERARRKKAKKLRAENGPGRPQQIPPLGPDSSDPDTTDLGCKYCSAVYHKHCLPLDHPYSKVFVCPDCYVEISCSKQQYEKEKMEIYEEHRVRHYATLICAKWRCIVAKSRYVTMKRFLIRLQAMARAFKLRHKFKQLRRMAPRPLRIHLIRGEDLPVADWDNQKADPYVILTVLDEKDRQMWRFDGDTKYGDLNPIFDEDFVIPGCAGNVKIVVTVVDRDELRDQFMGQGILHLNPRPSIETWRFGGKFRIQLDELLYMPKTVSGGDIRMDFGTIIPQGEIELEVMPMDGLVNQCGYLLGPPLDDESVAASFVKADVARIRKCWCMLSDHKLYVYSMIGVPSAKLILDLKLCSWKIEETRRDKQPYCMTFVNEKQSEFVFKCAKSEERDSWRMAIECSYDLHVNKRTPYTVERVQHAIALMKRKKRGVTPAKSRKGQRRGRRKTSKDVLGGGSAGRGSEEEAGLGMTVEIVKKELTISTTAEGGFDVEEPLTPAIIKRNKSKKSNLTKNGTSKALSAKEFRDQQMLAAQREIDNPKIDEEMDMSATGAGAMDADLLKEFKPKTVERTKFPALQRRTSTSSSALFGNVDVIANAPDVKEFKFVSTNKKSRDNMM